jgi:hypothetical protein
MPRTLEGFMALTSHFNLNSKTKSELKGLYIDLFNKLANREIGQEEHQQLQGALYRVRLCLEY